MTTMTHAKYNELQKKMDAIYNWANTGDEEVLAELHADYLNLKKMLEM